MAFSDGIEVGPVRVVVPGGQAGVERVDANTLAYPNVGTDTDLAVNPTMNGFEVFYQLRSPDAPEVQRLRLELPSGSSLRPTEGGGAEVVQGERVMLEITPPVAVDAQGRSVPTSYEIEGDVLAVRTAHRDGEFAFPVLVDPEFEAKEDWACGWGSTNCTATWFHSHGYALDGLRYWDPFESDPNVNWGLAKNCLLYGSFSNCYGPAHGGGSNWYAFTNPGWSNGQTGLHVWAGGGNGYPGSHLAEYVYIPPGTSTRIYRADFGAKFMRRGNSSTGGIIMFDGIYSYANWNWVPNGLQGFNGSEDGTNDRNLTHKWDAVFGDNAPGPQAAAFGLMNIGGYVAPSDYLNAYMGGAIMQLTDPEAPTISNPDVTGPTGWTRDGSWTISYSASDPGLGVRRLRLVAPSRTGGSHTQDRWWFCNGTRDWPCPASWGTASSGQTPFTVQAADLPEGTNNLSIRAADALGTGGDQSGRPHETTVNRTVKVDRTPPAFSLDDVDGTLRPEDRPWVPAGEQSLFIDATDSLSGITSAEVKIDGQSVKNGRATDPCLAQGCAELSYDFLIDTDDVGEADGEQPLSDGAHTVTVVVRDRAGNETALEPWTIRQERTPPDLQNFTGSLHEADGEQLAPNLTYQLHAEAKDESLLAPQSGLGKIEFALDEDEPDEAPERACPEGSCPESRTYEYTTDESPGGAHTLTVTATDRAGNTDTETITFNDPDVQEPQCGTAPGATPEINAQPITPTLAADQFQATTGLPEAFAVSQPLAINGAIFEPTLNGDDPDEFVAGGVVEGLLVDRIPADGATVTMLDDEAGPICMTPTTVAIGASSPTAPIGDATTVFANSRPATDTAVRPSMTGVDQWLQMRGPTAPQEFSWHVDSQPGLELRELANGNVALVMPAGPEEEATGIVDPPLAPTAAERKLGIANTDLHLTQAEEDRMRDQASTADDIFAVFRPSGKDADNGLLTPTLSVSGSTLTMSVPHSIVSAYPLTPGLNVTSAEAVDEGGTARADSETIDWTEADEAIFSEEAPPPSGSPATGSQTPAAPDEDLGGDIPDVSSAADIDPGGPEGEVDPELTPQAADPSTAFPSAETAARARGLEIGLTESDPATINHPQGDAFSETRKLRPFVYWDIMGLISRMDETDPDLRLSRCERSAVDSWLSYRNQINNRAPGRRIAVMVAFSGKASSADECGHTAPSPGLYRRQVARFLNAPEHGFVRRVEAWNEPDLERANTRNKPKRAADYWTMANRICHPRNDNAARCGAVVAGAFAGTPGERLVRPRRGSKRRIKYRETYRARIVHESRDRRPLVWSFHAWSDVHRYQIRRDSGRSKAPITKYFRFLFSRDRYENSQGRSPAVWLTEIGAPYRHACSRLLPRRKKPSACSAGNEDGVVRYGERRQRNAAAFILRAATNPVRERTMPGAIVVRRLYYFNLVDQIGERYGSGPTGRCAGSRTRCRATDSGLVGADVDSAAGTYPNYSVRDYRSQCKSLSVTPGARRPVFAVLNKEGRFTRNVREPKQC